MKKPLLPTFDVVVIGSGAAGLTLALSLAHEKSVCILQKESAPFGATPYAQGGIAAVLDKADSIENHIKDTEIAGAGLCDPKTVRFVVNQGPHVVAWLVELGVPFTKTETGFHLTQEGGHSHRRVIHAKDATGSAIHQVLLDKARAHPHIVFYENQLAFELLQDHTKRITAVRMLDENTLVEKIVICGAVILATGGASHIYPYATHPQQATGDGMAMAARAGCALMNLEFHQFHPTTLYHPKAPGFLLTEAIRGEGGILKNKKNQRLMQNIHAQMELAPRDIVARAIHQEIIQSHHPCVYLDISHKDQKFVRTHFPMVYEELLKHGLDLTKEAIPVVPAAHYTCGGIRVDLNGRTDIQNLFAIGEVACTGLHGANRMASNSLLECLVFAKAASEAILKDKTLIAPIDIELPDNTTLKKPIDTAALETIKTKIQQTLWHDVGIVRNNKGLIHAIEVLTPLYQDMAHYHQTYQRSTLSTEVENMSLIALCTALSAFKRQESRGLHFNQDFPQPSQEKKNTLIKMDKIGPQCFEEPLIDLIVENEKTIRK